VPLHHCTGTVESNPFRGKSSITNQWLKVALLAGASAGLPDAVQAQQQMADRMIRRDIPLTNQIRRALAAGTRDSTGRPGRN